MATTKFLGTSTVKFLGASTFRFVDQVPTSTPSIESTSASCDGTSCTLSWRVRNNDATTATIFSDTSVNPTTNRGSISSNGLTSTLGATVGTGGGNVYAKAEAAGKAVSSISTFFIAGSGGGGCLDENTIIYLADGTTKILKDIQVGDWLLGYDFEDMPDESEPNWREYTREDASEGHYVPVQVVFKKFDYYSSYYHINNDIKITKSHPLFIKKASTNLWGWIDSPDIQVGDIMLGKDRSEIIIESIDYVQETLEVVTLDTEETDNYFAGNNPILVHNSLEKGD